MSASVSDTAQLLWYEQAANAAASVGAISYGIHLAVFYKCITSIIHGKDRTNLRWIPFIISLLILGTTNIACSLRFNQLAFIDHRDYPNGPSAFLTEQQSNSANVGAVATSIIIMIFADVFMIFRIHTLWKRPVVTGILSLILLASVVMSGFHAIQLTKPKGFLGDSSSIQFSVPYVSLATALNILISVTLVPRLLELRRLVSVSIEDIREKFTSIEALVVESAFPSGLFSLVFIVLYGFQKVSSILFLPLLVQCMAIMPGLIVTRIVRGHGWSNDVVRRLRPSSTFFGQRSPMPSHDVSMGGLGADGGKNSSGMA